MTDILHLPGWKATAPRHEGDEMVIEADYIEPAVSALRWIKTLPASALQEHANTKRRVKPQDAAAQGAPGGEP